MTNNIVFNKEELKILKLLEGNSTDEIIDILTSSLVTGDDEVDNEITTALLSKLKKS